MLCSFLVPSRFRFEKLKKLIESIYEVSESDDFEIVVRLHDTDNDSLSGVAELAEYPRTRYIIGQTLNGYQSLHIFTAELIEAAKGQWCAQLNDDMLLFREPNSIGWESQLRAMPTTALVQPEIHRLNESHYYRDASGSAPFHANLPGLAAMLRQSGTPTIDTTLYKHYINAGAPIRFLQGLGFWHQWEGIESHAI